MAQSPLSLKRQANRHQFLMDMDAAKLEILDILNLIKPHIIEFIPRAEKLDDLTGANAVESFKHALMTFALEKIEDRVSSNIERYKTESYPSARERKKNNFVLAPFLMHSIVGDLGVSLGIPKIGVTRGTGVARVIAAAKTIAIAELEGTNYGTDSAIIYMQYREFAMTFVRRAFQNLATPRNYTKPDKVSTAIQAAHQDCSQFRVLVL